MPSEVAGAGLCISELTKHFRGAPRPAVDALSLDIAPGEFMTFLGPSGSGKTTTLNMIADLEAANSGRISMDGRDIAALPAHRRDLGMVFQQYALFPHMTAAQNIAFPLRQRKLGKPEIARKVQQVLGLVRLGDYGDRLPAHLSGGQQQRVALARAVVFGPRALLMDEPLGALDKKLREELQVEIGRLHRELGVTVVFVTHDQEEALALSDRIAIFDEGGIEQVGTAEDLYERPATRFVARFVGDSNIVDGTLGSDGGHRVLRGAGFVVRVPDAGLPDGTAAALVIRPERLRIDPDPGAADSGLNTLDGTVTDVVYQGAYRKILVDLDVGVSGTVREAVGSADPARPGDRTHVSWDVEAGALVPADPVRESGTESVTGVRSSDTAGVSAP